MSTNIIPDTVFSLIEHKEVYQRDKAEYEFGKRFSKTRPEQQIARVCMYYKHTGIGWKLIKSEEMEEI